MTIIALIAILAILGTIAVSIGPIMYAHQLGAKENESQWENFATNSPEEFDQFITELRIHQKEKIIQDLLTEKKHLEELSNLAFGDPITH